MAPVLLLIGLQLGAQVLDYVWDAEAVNTYRVSPTHHSLLQSAEGAPETRLLESSPMAWVRVPYATNSGDWLFTPS